MLQPNLTPLLYHVVLPAFWSDADSPAGGGGAALWAEDPVSACGLSYGRRVRA